MLCAKKATLATSRRPSRCCCGVSSSKSSRAKTRRGDDERNAIKNHRLVFYRHSLCPYAHRVQLCLDELDALRKTRVVDVDLSKTPEWYLEKTRGRGMVPTMEFFFDDDDDDDKEEEGFTSRKSEKKELVGESLEINRRLWDQFEGIPQTTDDVERFTRKCDDTFIRAGLRAIGGGWSFTRERNENALERLEEEIWQLDALIESHAVVSSRATTNARNDTIFLFGGDRASLADLAIYPFAERFELALKFFQGYTLGHAEYTTKKSGKSPSGDHQHPIRFQNWLETMRRLPSVRNARVKDEDALLRSWDRTMRLDYFDYETADDVHP